MQIKEAIMNQLRTTETKYNVKIPLAVESGSRGWGFASPDSDYDCRFIYVHEQDHYLSITEKKDVIECAADEVFDINGWDLKKAIFHIMKSNAVIFEWLSSNEIYIKNKVVTNELFELATIYFNPIAVSYHYLSMAKNKLAEISLSENAKLKKYFYILRPIANLNFIKEYGKMPYMEYPRTLAEISVPSNILKEINNLIAIKKVSDESYNIPKCELLLKYFNDEINKHTESIDKMKYSKPKEDLADETFRKVLRQVWSND